MFNLVQFSRLCVSCPTPLAQDVELEDAKLDVQSGVCVTTDMDAYRESVSPMTSAMIQGWGGSHDNGRKRKVVPFDSG